MNAIEYTAICEGYDCFYMICECCHGAIASECEGDEIPCCPVCQSGFSNIKSLVIQFGPGEVKRLLQYIQNYGGRTLSN